MEFRSADFLDVQGRIGLVNQTAVERCVIELALRGPDDPPRAPIWWCYSRGRDWRADVQEDTNGQRVVVRLIVIADVIQVFIYSPSWVLLRKHPSLLLGYWKVNSLLYANGVVSMSSTGEYLRCMLDTCE